MSYDNMIAEVNNEKVVYYEKFGCYDGEWLLLTLTQKVNYGNTILSNYQTFKMYKDWYGSCSGCDAYERWIDECENVRDITIEEKKEFVKAYKPFLIIPYENMKNILNANVLKCIIPANIDYEEKDIDDVVREIEEAIIKLFPEIKQTNIYTDILKRENALEITGGNNG